MSHAYVDKNRINFVLAKAMDERIERERSNREREWEAYDESAAELGITPEEADDYCREAQIEADLYDCDGCHTLEQLDERYANLVSRCRCRENACALREDNAQSAQWGWGWSRPITKETVECLRCIKQRLGHQL